MIAAALLLAAVAPAPSGWREFERSWRGVGEDTAYYHAPSVKRKGARVRAWTRWKFLLSGLPDIVYYERIEIDCARREARWLHASGGPARIRRTGGVIGRRFAPIADGSLQAALAAVLCP